MVYGTHGALFDLSDVSAQATISVLVEEVAWLERQCRALLDQRSRAFRLGRRTAFEEVRDLCRTIAEEGKRAESDLPGM